VTALYEVVPRGEGMRLPSVDPLKYQREPEGARASGSGESFTVKLRYKEPDGQTSRLMEHPVTDRGAGIRNASDDLRFAAAVAAFGMILRDSSSKGSADHDLVLSLARDAIGDDDGGHRREFLRLVRDAASLGRTDFRR
jgi:Ca-activated chloride channel family protein